MLDFAKYLESILHLFEYLILYYVFSQIFEQRLKNQYMNYLLIMMLVAVNVSAELILGLNSVPSSFIKLSAVLIILLSMFRGKIVHLLIVYIISFLVLTVCDVIIISSTAFIFQFDTFEFVTIGFNRIGLGILSKSLFLVLGQFLISKFKSVYVLDVRKLYQLLLILLINTAFIVLAGDIYFQNKSTLSNHVGFILIIMIGIMLISLLMVRITESIVEYSKKERDWQMQEEEYRRQIFYLNHLDDINRQMKSLRHDFNHHIGCLNGMLEHDEVNQAKDYVNELVCEADQFNVAFSTKHMGISGLLSSKYQLMRKKKIEFTWSIDFPTEINVKLIDVSIVLGNALDNSIEACEKLDENDRHINLFAKEKMDHIIIKIRNSCLRGHSNKDYATTKDDVENHGYGLKNIKFVVEKYGGIMSIEENSDEFLLNIALPNIKEG